MKKLIAVTCRDKMDLSVSRNNCNFALWLDNVRGTPAEMWPGHLNT